MEGDGWYVPDLSLDIVMLTWLLGKYVGNRPIRLKKADNANTRPVEIGHRKARQLEQARKDKRHKPY